MNEEKIREIIREEIYAFNKVNKFEFSKRIQIRDGKNIQLGRTTGTKIGTAIDQLLGFYGATPVDRPASVSDAGSVGATYSQSEVEQIVTAVNAVIARLVELGLLTSS